MVTRQVKQNNSAIGLLRMNSSNLFSHYFNSCTGADSTCGVVNKKINSYIYSYIVDSSHTHTHTV